MSLALHTLQEEYRKAFFDPRVASEHAQSQSKATSPTNAPQPPHNEQERAQQDYTPRASTDVVDDSSAYNADLVTVNIDNNNTVGNGSLEPGRPRQPLPGDCGYLLHSWWMQLQHPVSGEWLQLEAAPPQILCASWEDMQLREEGAQ